MYIVIARVHENLFNGEADELTAPTTEGEVTILKDHEPFVAALKSGTVTVRSGKAIEKRFTVEGGVLEVSSSRVTVLL